MPDETRLDTAIPPIGWQDGKRETEPERSRKRPSEKKRPPPAKERAKGLKAPPAEGTGTKIDVTV